MTQPIARDSIYRGRRFRSETIELCVRWYITYRLSYRDLAAMMAERRIFLSHTTIMRWVMRYVPEYEKRWSRYTKPLDSSWRMDETAVRVRGGSHYLYRAVDKRGNTVTSMLCASRDVNAAKAFFRHAIKNNSPQWRRSINLDGNAATHRALRLLRDEQQEWRAVHVRCCRYLNNVVEQDHRAIKRRCASMLGLKTFATAAVTLAGIELAHRIRKRQFLIPYVRADSQASLRELWDQALSCTMHVGAPSLPDLHEPPPMHQISQTRSLNRRERSETETSRSPRKIFDGRGLYQLVMPTGSRYWRYNYRFNGKHKTIALGTYPDVSLEMARARHQAVRTLLANNIDPMARIRSLSKHGRSRGWVLEVHRRDSHE